MKKAINSAWERTKEHLERPTRLKALDSTLDNGKLLLEKIKKVPLKDTPFTQVEIDSLEKSIAEITVNYNILIIILITIIKNNYNSKTLIKCFYINERIFKFYTSRVGEMKK